MISALVPFEEIIETVKDQTGIANATPLLEKFRRFAFKAERELGYSGAVVLKKIIYVRDITNFDGIRIWMPIDWLEFYTIVDEFGEVDIKSYIISGNYLHFTDNIVRESVQLYYYGLMCDGFGNPCITRNHEQAVVDYIKWRIKSPLAFLGKRAERNDEKSYEQDWKDSRDAAIGNDVWPSNEQDWTWLSTIGNMSTKDSMIYYLYDEVPNLCALEAQTECSLRPTEITMKAYIWQYENLITNIADGPNIDQTFLNDETTEHSFLEMLQGKVIAFSKIGRIGIIIQGGSEKEYQIWDILNQRIDHIVMDHYRNSSLKLDVFITKEFYSYSNMFLKLKKS